MYNAVLSIHLLIQHLLIYIFPKTIFIKNFPSMSTNQILTLLCKMWGWFISSAGLRSRFPIMTARNFTNITLWNFLWVTEEALYIFLAQEYINVSKVPPEWNTSIRVSFVIIVIIVIIIIVLTTEPFPDINTIFFRAYRV